MDCRVRIDFPYYREDARSAIDHEGFDAVPKGIPENPQIAGDFVLSFLFADAEPNGLPDTVNIVREEDASSRQGISVDHQATDVLECLVDMQ